MIRIASKKDIPRINELGKYISENFPSTYNLDKYIDENKYIILVYEDIIIKAFIIILKNIDDYEIEAIAVDENYRRVGIGKALLDYFFEQFLKKGDTILLEVAENNIKAINLYKKYGFEIISRRKKYYKEFDALIMKKVK